MAKPSFYKAIPQPYRNHHNEPGYIMVQAVFKINPAAEISIKDQEDPSSITFHTGTPAIPTADIETQIAVVEAELQTEADAGTQRDE